MKEIKRYGCDVYYDRGMYECSGGEFVSHDDYAASVAERDMRIAALQDQVRALAAEMAVVESIHADAVFITDDDFDKCPQNVQKIIKSLAVMLIPATDAFIREIRAQAIEDYSITVGAGKNGAIYAARIRAGEQP